MNNIAADPQADFARLLLQRDVPERARPYFVRWAAKWSAAVADTDTPLATLDYFEDLGRLPNLEAWQFRQAVRAVAWYARDILHLPWAAKVDWRGLADAARPLEPDHRTIGREAIRVAAKPLPSPAAGPRPDTESEVARICDEVRRAARLGGLAYETEKTYVHWNARFTRFCLAKLSQSPQDAGPPAITAYLDFLALERQVSAATQRSGAT